MSSRFAVLRSLLGVAFAGTLLLSLASPATARKTPPKPPAKSGPEAAGDKDKPFKEWDKVVKDATVMPGFFTAYRKPENLYLEIRPEQLEQDFLGIFSLARGIGSNFILGGLPLNDRLLAFERSGDRVLLLEKNARFTAPKGSAFERAMEISEGHSVLASLKIESIRDSSQSLLVDVTPLLVSDFTDLAEGIGQRLGNNTARFDKDRSALTTVKNFPDNLEVEALLTYTPGNRKTLNLETVPDERYIPITVHYSFSKLPAVPMTPRLADDRVGYFLTVKKDFSRDQDESFFVRYANRWRLEKQDPAAALSEPVQPIVFYVDRTVPEPYRPYIREGIEKWQRAFEAAGFNNAIVAKDAPDDPDWDAEDVRYSTIRWIVSSQQAFGAIGPSRVDPRTGEILDADVLIEGPFVQGFRNSYRRYVGPEAIAAQTLPALGDWPAYLPQDLRCDAQTGLADGGALLRTALLVNGALPPGSPVPESYVRDALVWVTMHEVGHTLGLRHNFRSSTATPLDKLQDKAWTQEHGLTASVMDYLTPNISSDPANQGEYYGSVVGDYDLWAIRFGYAPSGAATPEADGAFARAIADESMAPGHEYSTDDDTYPANALDPRTNIWDLGGDPLAFAKARSAYVRGLWIGGTLEPRVLGDHGEYPVLRRAMDTLLGQYARALGLAVKYVGGQLAVRNHRGQAGAVEPLRPVPAARQREALDFLAERAFAADAFAVPPAMLNRMPADRWSHWGVLSPFAPTARVDYDLNDKAIAIQTALLRGITAPHLLARVREAETRGPGGFTLAELFDRTTKMLWGEVGPVMGSGMRALEGPTTRRQLQRAYVDRLATMLVDPEPGTPDDARALARLQLVRIDGQARRALTAEGLGDNTQAHLLESRARIKRTLEASRVADEGGGDAMRRPSTAHQR